MGKISSGKKLMIQRCKRLITPDFDLDSSDGSIEVLSTSEPLNLSYDSFYLLLRFHEVDSYERIDGGLVRFTYSLVY